MAGLTVAERLALALPRRGAQAARTAELELRCRPVTLKPPQGLKDAPLALWAVSLREATPPAGVDRGGLAIADQCAHHHPGRGPGAGALVWRALGHRGV